MISFLKKKRLFVDFEQPERTISCKKCGKEVDASSKIAARTGKCYQCRNEKPVILWCCGTEEKLSPMKMNFCQANPPHYFHLECLKSKWNQREDALTADWNCPACLTIEVNLFQTSVIVQYR